jgi:hypothetical protein
VTRPHNLTLSVLPLEAQDPALVQVRFYREDALLGVDQDGADGWFWSGSTEGWPVGQFRFYARGQDDSGAWSELASVEALVTSWQNPENPFDVVDNGYVAALDVLTIINQINLHGSRILPPRTADDLHLGYIDVNGDGRVTPEDVLDVINYINAQLQTRPTAEGENTIPTDQPDTLAGLREMGTIVEPDATRLPSPVHHERRMDIPVRRAADDGQECPSYSFGSVRRIVSEHLPPGSPDSHDTGLRPSRRPSSATADSHSELELPDGQSLLDSLPGSSQPIMTHSSPLWAGSLGNQCLPHFCVTFIDSTPGTQSQAGRIQPRPHTNYPAHEPKHHKIPLPEIRLPQKIPSPKSSPCLLKP